MSTIADFNRIDDCDKIDPMCIDAYLDVKYDPDNDPTTLCIQSSWGGECVDLEPLVKAAETCTTLYLSPEEDPNCLVYEPECGDNICIHGDDLSRIISMQYLKDVTQETAPSDGIVYMYNSQTELFEPYDLKTFITNVNTAINNINNTLTNHGNRITNIELKLTPPPNTPSDARVLFGNINILSDYDAVVNSSGVATTLNRTHGVYGHDANVDLAYDELMGQKGNK